MSVSLELPNEYLERVRMEPGALGLVRRLLDYAQRAARDAGQGAPQQGPHQGGVAVCGLERALLEPRHMETLRLEPRHASRDAHEGAGPADPPAAPQNANFSAAKHALTKDPVVIR